MFIICTQQCNNQQEVILQLNSFFCISTLLTNFTNIDISTRNITSSAALREIIELNFYDIEIEYNGP